VGGDFNMTDSLQKIVWQSEKKNSFWEAYGSKDWSTVHENGTWINNALAEVPDTKYEISTKEDVLYDIIKKNKIIAVVGSFFGDEGKGKTVDAIANHPDVTMVARANSGQNAGHTVTIDDKKYVFHLVPSGIMVDGVTNYIGPECVVDPITFLDDEISTLVDEGVQYKDTETPENSKLIMGNTHIITPYHKLLEIILSLPNDFVPGETPIEDVVLNNKSTLQGIAPIHGAMGFRKSIRLDDLFYEGNNNSELKNKIDADILFYEAVKKHKGIDDETLLQIIDGLNEKVEGRVPDHVRNFLLKKEKQKQRDYLVDLYKERVRDNKVFPTIGAVKEIIEKRLENKNEKLLVEGSQSYFLSNTIDQFFGLGTSANTTAPGLLSSLGIDTSRHKHTYINVAKAPGSSKVGAGPNPGGHLNQNFYSKLKIETLEDKRFSGFKTAGKFDDIQKQYWESINNNGILNQTEIIIGEQKYAIGAAMGMGEAMHFGEKGATTKRPRVTGLFDLVLLSSLKQGKYLTISAVDRGDDLENIGLVIGYVYHNPSGEKGHTLGHIYENGKIIKPGDYIPKAEILQHCHPIIKKIPGWKNDGFKLAADSWDGKHLHENVQNLIANVELYVPHKEVFSIGNGPNRNDLIYIQKK
jgi:adenylosuccinate synthase